MSLLYMWRFFIMWEFIFPSLFLRRNWHFGSILLSPHQRKNSRWKTVQELFSLCFWCRLTQKHSLDLLCLNCFQASNISVSFQYAFPSVRPCEHLYIYQCMLSQCTSMSVCILMKQLLKCSPESLSIALTLGLILGNKIQSQFNTGEQR